MGYRSNVVYVIRFDKPEHLRTCLDLQDAKHTGDDAEHWTWLKEYMSIADPDVQTDKDTLLVFHHEDVKWYDDYPEVKMMEELKSFAEKAFNASWRYVRTGEETDDIEVAESDNAEELYYYAYPCVTVEGIPAGTPINQPATQGE